MMGAAFDRSRRFVLWDEREISCETVLATIGKTGLSMTINQIEHETGLGPEVIPALDLLVARGLVGRLGDDNGTRYFPLRWLQRK